MNFLLIYFGFLFVNIILLNRFISVFEKHEHNLPLIKRKKITNNMLSMMMLSLVPILGGIIPLIYMITFKKEVRNK
jgi:hypothetical protein